MNILISSVLIISSVLLITAIIMQNRGAGVGGVFGGSGDVYRTKRGAEKILYNATIVLAVIFFGTALYNALFV